MNGSVLKEFWRKSGFTQKELADKLGITTSALGQQFNSTDLRSGTIEKFCEILKLKINSLYEGTEYAIITNDINVIGEPRIDNVVPVKTFDKLYQDYQNLLKERDEFKDLAMQLKTQISLMEKGHSVSEIAQKEVV